MSKVWLGKGEDGSVRIFSDRFVSTYAENVRGAYFSEVDVDDATLARWKNALADYARAQDEMAWMRAHSKATEELAARLGPSPLRDMDTPPRTQP